MRSFTVLAHWDARPDIGQPEGSVSLLLNEENDWSTELGKTLAVGTVVTLSEPEAGGLPPDVGWDGEPAWSGDGITDNGDGTATLTITESDTVPSFVMTNTLTKLTGTFGVAKEVSGDFDFDSPELAGVKFTVQCVLARLVRSAGRFDPPGARRRQLLHRNLSGTAGHRHGGDALRGHAVGDAARRAVERHRVVR